ncbi:hypothetical protein BCR42DRAFT_297839, partial [Absidia repens]
EHIGGLLKKQRNWKHAVGHLYSKLGACIESDYPSLKVLSLVCECHFRQPEVFLPDVVTQLSEASLIIKVWGPIFEAAMYGSGLILHWGDTISIEPQKSNRRLDLRILCMNVDSSYDVGNSEFARSVNKSKYFYDKRKLILNGKVQLNNILSVTGNCTSLVMPLIVVQ